MVNEVVMKRYNTIKKVITNNLDSERKEGFINLMNYLENETDWLTSPASTKYHCSYEGGLVDHSVSVAETILKMTKLLAPEIPYVSAVLVGLLHDIGKAGQYIMKPPTVKQQQYGYPGSIAFNNDLVYMEHESRSLKIISKFMELTDEEWGAIEYHNQPWNGTSSAFRSNKLMTLLQNSDYWSTVYLEVGGTK